jgi:hypothetical protein
MSEWLGYKEGALGFYAAKAMRYGLPVHGWTVIHIFGSSSSVASGSVKAADEFVLSFSHVLILRVA